MYCMKMSNSPSKVSLVVGNTSHNLDIENGERDEDIPISSHSPPEDPFDFLMVHMSLQASQHVVGTHMGNLKVVTSLKEHSL